MRLAVCSDIHANLEGLNAVCRAAERRGVEAWACLGDIVGYGADPHSCLCRIRELTDQSVLGNHDAAAVGMADLSRFNRHAHRAALWTAAQLTPDERRYLVDLPLTRQSADALYAHGNPDRPEVWSYVFSADEVVAALACSNARLCFIGHSHEPFVCAVYQDESQWIDATGGLVEMREEARYMINVGSVGQPRDGDPRACFVIWDDQRCTLEFVRAAYDITAAQHKIIAAGLPPLLAERLACGR